MVEFLLSFYLLINIVRYRCKLTRNNRITGILSWETCKSITSRKLKPFVFANHVKNLTFAAQTTLLPVIET